ncbi:hypothetical protein GT037_008998 [Alternaria burnsii]|uniref:F-box domain-containing protein n=1 Tax=Alternaria burnsii TaxID=1187904 RepID=A0A8H7AYP9_9PLEO|nr:uncharacterized protein GT037_008998 [Alternaria burnsii]KAF7673047.1 hypothetical protein GT037_008998 [Alternaria burnsii]
MITACDGAKAALVRASQLPFRLLDLPLEVVGATFDYLEDEELIGVRCVCRAFNANSANAFGRRFFRHLVVILHPTSLTTLFEICHHPVLSKHVRQITVSGERVGHSIYEVKEEETQKDLQVSVQRSGMDSFILNQVFRELENLQIIQIDVISFYHCDPEPVDAGIRCGKAHILSKKTQEDEQRERRGDSGANRVYDLVLRTLQEANLHNKIGLGFEFWNTEYSNDDMITFFDLDSAVWKDHFSKQVRQVSVLGQVSHAWLQKLLSTASDLRKFEFQGNYTFLELSYQPAGSFQFHWPGFSHIHLTDVFLSHNEWTNFLRLHAATLKHISCSSIGFPQGNWIEPLQIIETMPRIEYLWLFRLLEKAPYPHSPMTVRRCSQDDDGVLQLFDSEPVELALSAMRSQPRTAFMGRGVKSEAGEVYLHRVAFDVGEAALEGDIIYRDGDWVFAEVAADL